MRNILLLIIALACAVVFTQCGTFTRQNAVITTTKMSANDPFKKTITPSQEFSIDAKTDNVVEGKGGTIAVFPKGCFKDANGIVAEGNIKIELTEALTAADMVLSNLTTTADGKPLVTGGMLYFNATLNGAQLTVNTDNPVFFEIPTKHKLPGMMAYKGTRDSAGNMNWTNPKELEKFLTPVDINQLDFLPPHFMEAVEYGMPYKNHKTATRELADSLYYLLSVMNGSELVQGFEETDNNEAYYNPNSKVVNGKYTKGSYNTSTAKSDSIADTGSLKKLLVDKYNGIDPASIKVIHTEKYQNTLIATREFEQRLPYIFNTCDNKVLEFYIKNINRNMYEIDSMVCSYLLKQHISMYDHYADDFKRFEDLHQTNVKDADKYATILKGYYNTQLAGTMKKMEESKQKMISGLKQKNEEAKQLVKEYCEVLDKREKYRMEKYGFEWTETGWINVDNGTIPKTWGPAPLTVKVNNGSEFDRVYSYIIYLDMKSLYRLNTQDNTSFFGGNINNNAVLMPKESSAVLISIGYKDEAPAMAVKEIRTNKENAYDLTISKCTMEEVTKALATYNNGYQNENLIRIDQDYMLKFFQEQQRQKALIKEAEFFQGLWNTAHPCHPIVFAK